MQDFRRLTLYVLRHGECEHNLRHEIAAQNDTPLTPLGRKQAHENGRLLAEICQTFEGLDFFASSLHRTAVTMELVRAAANLPAHDYKADRRLMELDCGEHSGWPWSEVRRIASQDPIWQSEPWNYRHPGGESLAMLHARVGTFLETLARDCVIVAHAGTLRSIRAHVLGLSPAAAMEYHPPNAGILRLSGGTEAYFGGDNVA